jgi:hypothetical protein
MKSDSEIIDDLGGNQEVAKLCAPTIPEVVSGWRRRGIPRAWRALLIKAKPEVFECVGESEIS